MATSSGAKIAKVFVLGLILTGVVGYGAARYLQPWESGERFVATVIAVRAGAGEVDGPKHLTLRLDDGREVTLLDEGRSGLAEGGRAEVEVQTTRFSDQTRFILIGPL